MSDRIDQLHAFVAVAELRSFTAAARLLGATQSTVSKRIAALEVRSGTPLFRRSTRAIAVTAAGEALLPEARAVVAAFVEAERVLDRRDALAGRIRLTAPPTLARARLMPLIAAFQLDHPRIEIDACFADGRLDLAREGIDLAVRVGAQGGERGRRIGIARRMLVASPAYLEAAGVPREPADLTRHRCLTYSLLDDGQRWTFESEDAVTVRGPLAANDPDILRLAALAGLGIVLSACWLFVDDVASGRLVHVLPDHSPLSMPIHIITRPAGVPPPHVRKLADYLADAFAADPLLAPPPEVT